MDTNPAPPARQPFYREDGWTPEVQEAFIIALMEYGSVQAAAKEVDRHFTSAYRLRARDAGFAKAWDAAKRMAYARLRDEAIDRALNGAVQEVWYKGEWIGTKRVRSDRLLMTLLRHLQDAPPGAETLEDGRSNTAARLLTQLAEPPAPPPVRLRPRTLRIAGPGGGAVVDPGIPL